MAMLKMLMKKTFFLTAILVYAGLLTTSFANPIPEPNQSNAMRPIIITNEKNTFTLSLPANPSTGYQWFLKTNHTNCLRQMLKLTKYRYLPNENTKKIGAPGKVNWSFTAKKNAFLYPQLCELTFVYLRPWETSVAKTQKFTILST